MTDSILSDFVTLIDKEVTILLAHPGTQLQAILSVTAVLMAIITAQLTQRIIVRTTPLNDKNTFFIKTLLPNFLLPTLVIVFLILAGWVAKLLIPNHLHTIGGFIKFGFAWFAARAIMLLANRHFMANLISKAVLLLTLLSVTNLLDPTQTFLSEITFETSTIQISLLTVIKGIFLLVILFWGASVASQALENRLRMSQLSFNARELCIKFSKLTLYFVAFVLALNEVGVDLTALTVFGGALAVGIGFGLQKITSNFISGIILLFEQTIEAGDLIEVGGEKGWVRQMAIRHTLIETFDGREMLIPNEDLIIGKVTNWTYTHTRARIDILVTVTYASDALQVQQLLLKAASAHKECLKTPEPNCFIKEFTNSGIQFQLVFWIGDVKQGTAATRSEVMLAITSLFREHTIHFAVSS